MSTQEEEVSSSVCDEATMRTCGGRGGSVLSMVGTLFFSTSPLAITAEELALTVCSALCVIIVAVVIIRFLLWKNRARETLVRKPANDLSHCKTQETTDDERKTCGFEKKSQGTTTSRPCTVSTSSQATETLGDERDKVDDNVLAALFGHELACRAHILLVASESFLELWQWHSSSLQQVVLLQLQEDTEKKKKLVTKRSQQLASVKPMQREVANKDEEHAAGISATKKEPEFIDRSDSWNSFIEFDAVDDDDRHHRTVINHDVSPPPRVPSNCNDTQQQQEAAVVAKGILKTSSRVGEKRKDEGDKQRRNEKVSRCSDGDVPVLVPRSLRRSGSSSRSPLCHSQNQTSTDEVSRSGEADAEEAVIENELCEASSSSSSQPTSSASPPVLTPFNMRSRRQHNASSPSAPPQQNMASSVDSVDDEEITAKKRTASSTTTGNRVDNVDECDEIIAMALQCAVSNLLEVVAVSPIPPAAAQSQEGDPSLVSHHGDALSTLCVGDLLVDINGSAFRGKEALADVLASLLLSHRTNEEEEGEGGNGHHHHRSRSVVLVNVLRQDGDSLSLKTIEVAI